jgi:hypothetical protein
MALLFSLAALGDCSFVELDERIFLPPELDLPTEISQTRFVGLLTWQKLDGYVDYAARAGEIIMSDEPTSPWARSCDFVKTHPSPNLPVLYCCRNDEKQLLLLVLRGVQRGRPSGGVL